MFSHLSSWSCLCRSPWNHAPIVALSQDHRSHAVGMDALNSFSSASTRSPASAMVPAMASLKFLSVLVVRLMMMFRRSISCLKCTVSGCVGPPGSLRSASLVISLTNAGGTFPSRSSQILSTISSGLCPPPPPPDLGMVEITVSTRSATASVRKVRSALGCSPKISGLSCAGRRSMAARNSSMFAVSGTTYPG